MTLPSSGAISISQAAAEFGITLPCVFPDAFYGKPGMPSSGNLTLPDDFYGKSNVTFTPAEGSYSVYELDNGTASFTITCNISAVWTWSRTGSEVGGSASIASGGSGTSFTMSQTPPIGTTGGARSSTFTVSATAAGITKNFTIILDTETTPSGGG